MHSDALFLSFDPSFHHAGALLSDKILNGTRTSSWGGGGNAINIEVVINW